ncbi:hypothetical protein GCM10027079_30500 [Sediminivirga luteola]|uniref:Membrane protein n=2 Tax=Sediminivirga luteola TaxID=1774748 RepID=A0A8J2XLF5_9MICO|nr:membrane protein [Sediminivirga luteola]
MESSPNRRERVMARSSKNTVRITGAARSGEEDINLRMRKYLITMGIRVVCLVLAFVTPGWWTWVFLAGAVLLPWVAVLIANAGRERSGTTSGYVQLPVYPQLEQRRPETDEPGRAAGSATEPGELDR